MAFTSMSVLVAVMVSNIHGKGHRDTPLPTWLRKTTLVLSKLLCRKARFISRYKPREQCVYGGEILSVTSKSNGECHGAFTKLPNNKNDIKQTQNLMPGFEEEGQMRNGLSQQSSDTYGAPILQALQCLLDQNSAREKEEQIQREWEEAAHIIDRFLFWTFVVGHISSSVYLLVFCPKSIDSIEIDKT